MQATKTENRITSIHIEDIVPHPDSPNRMSKRSFAKLVRNIERTGLYEPLVVRPCQATHCHSCESRNPAANEKVNRDCFQIVNGHHRWKALRQLGYETVEAVVWDIDDQDADILLATLNRLGGSDALEKKLALMARLNQRQSSRDLAALLPHSARQIHRLAHMSSARVPRIKPGKPALANPIVFFLSDAQQQIVENALSCAPGTQHAKTRAAIKADALTSMAQGFIERKSNEDQVCPVRK